MTIRELEIKAFEIRKLILKMTHHAGMGHVGGSLSETDILTVLFFEVMNIDPHNPSWENRDRFILSKGHSTPGYYSALALRGFFPTETLKSFDEFGTTLQGHPDMHKTPGVDISSGSLGQGLSCGIGMALGRKALGKGFFTYVLIGDGEMQEGQVWEAAMYGGSKKVTHIIGILDYNKVQLAASTVETLDIERVTGKWEAFGWDVIECNGHSIPELLSAFNNAKVLSLQKPVIIIAHTIKGKGVNFMENKWEWHGKAPDDAEYRNALEYLKLTHQINSYE
jgi:transketolase